MYRILVVLAFLILLPSSINAQTDLDELLAPIDFLEETSAETTEDQQYTLEITQLETQAIDGISSLTAQEQASFVDYGYVIRRMDDPAKQPASIHLSLDSTIKSFEVIPGMREDISPTTMTVTTSDTTGYQLISMLENQLQTASGHTIPLTSCDDECSAHIAGLWAREDAYGWGYTLDGTTYKSFDLNEYNVMMKNGYLNAQESTKLGLSVFPSTTQPLGTYGTTIQVVVLPW